MTQYPQIPDSEIESQLLAFMSELGVRPAKYERLIFDGILHRYDIDEDTRGSKNGAYLVHTDGIPAGFVQDWKRNVKTNWKYDGGGLTDEQREYFNSEEYKEEQEAERKRREEERKAIQEKAALIACDRFHILTEKPEKHQYLTAKRINAYDVKLETDGSLVVPLRNINGEVRSLQYIYPNGAKKLYLNASVKGLFWSVGLDMLKPDTEGIILIGEGFATMAKVHELTGLPSISGISCHYIKEVAKVIRERYPKCKIYVTADNDKATELRRDYNPGIQAGKELVKLGYADYIIYPEFENPEDGTDWDDYALLYGDEACALKLKAGLERAPLEERQTKYHEQAEQLGLVSYEMFSTFCQPVKSPLWLIEDWIPAESLIMLFGPSGSGKGFVMCDIAYAIANPNITYWHGKKVLTHGPVVYIAAEGQRGMRKRLAGLVLHYGVSVDGLEMAVIKEPLIIDEKDPKAGILKAIANIGSIYPNPAMVVFDTLNANMSGDENKTIDATAFTHSCLRIIQELHCSVMPVHHTGLNPDTQNRARGSSVLKAAMDLEQRVSRVGQIITLEMTKSKDTELQPPIVFDQVQIEVPGFFNAKGEPDTTCILETNDGLTETLSDPASRESASAKTPKAESFAKDTYQEVARKHGILIEDENGHEIAAVKLDDWRDVFYSMSSADNPNTKRSQFNRARSLMLEDRHILFKKEIAGNEYYCIASNGDAYSSAIIVRLHRNNDGSRYQN